MEEQTKQQQTWWQKHSKLLMRIGLISLVVVVIVLIILIILGYIFNWDWTGLTATDKSKPTTNIIVYQPGKTLWDWLGLLGVLAIPVVVGFGAAWFTRTQQLRDQERERLQNERDQEAARLQHERDLQLADQRAKSEQEAAEKRAQAERDIAEDNQREEALQAYIKEMSELLLHENLRNSKPEHEVRMIARVRTLTVLPRLDGKRKRNLLLFLYDAGLINKGDNIINMSEADLSEADLSDVSLCRPREIRDSSGKRGPITNVSADLSGANLRNANLNGANLTDVKLGAEGNEYMVDLTLEISDQGSLSDGEIRAILNGAKLVKANLFRADMGGVHLRGADLSGAFLGGANLQRADLRGANLHGADLSTETLVEYDGNPEEDPLDLSGWTGANLSRANLSRANLSEINLWQANLSGANLRGADLSGADLRDADLRDADLRDAEGTTNEKLKEQAKSLKGATMPDGSKHP